MARGERRHAASGCLWRWTSYGAKRLGEERGSIGRRAHRHVLHRSMACASVVPLAVFIEAVHLRAVARLHSAVTHACAPGAGAGCQSRGGCQPPSVQGVSWPSLWAFSSLHAGAWTGAQRRTGQCVSERHPRLVGPSRLIPFRISVFALRRVSTTQRGRDVLSPASSANRAASLYSAIELFPNLVSI